MAYWLILSVAAGSPVLSTDAPPEALLRHTRAELTKDDRGLEASQPGRRAEVPAGFLPGHRPKEASGHGRTQLPLRLARLPHSNHGRPQGLDPVEGEAFAQIAV